MTRYRCMICDQRWDYESVRHVGCCPSCGGALLYANIVPPRTIPIKPIMAKLVQLGNPAKPKMLPRNSAAAAPPP